MDATSDHIGSDHIGSDHIGSDHIGSDHIGKVDDARTGWVADALCRTTDPEALFVSGAAQRIAAVLCRHCPVIAECLAEALDNRVEFGVWGGKTERQRRALLKQHPEVVSWHEFITSQLKHLAFKTD